MKPKLPFEKGPKDRERKSMKEGSKKEERLDAKQKKFKNGGKAKC